MITNVYVDGFNLYYGCLKGTSHKWLDLDALCRTLLPNNQLHRIRYFTARVKVRDDPLAPVRQDLYLQALSTLPHVSTHLGHFLVTKARMALATPPPAGPRTVEVLKTEEKGSDVNLATYLLTDAFRGDCQTAVVITNDSDLAEPIRVISQELSIPVGLINPHPRQASRALLRQGPAFVKSIRPSVLARSQFPAEIVVRGRTIHRPQGW
ncbi:MAG TPA: NYN domain-containing protein [Candidatus Limnocylindrales bacterium]